MQVPPNDPRIEPGDRVEILDGTYGGCRGVVVSTNGKLFKIRLDPTPESVIPFMGQWSRDYIAPLNVLDRLAEDV